MLVNFLTTDYKDVAKYAQKNRFFDKFLFFFTFFFLTKIALRIGSRVNFNYNCLIHK